MLKGARMTRSTFWVRTLSALPLLVLTLDACSDAGPVAVANQQSCGSASVVALNVLQGATIDCSAGSMIELTGGGARYLVVPEFATGDVTDRATSFVLSDSDALASPASALASANTTRAGSFVRLGRAGSRRRWRTPIAIRCCSSVEGARRIDEAGDGRAQRVGRTPSARDASSCARGVGRAGRGKHSGISGDQQLRRAESNLHDGEREARVHRCEHTRVRRYSRASERIHDDSTQLIWSGHRWDVLHHRCERIRTIVRHRRERESDRSPHAGGQHAQPRLEMLDRGIHRRVLRWLRSVGRPAEFESGEIYYGIVPDPNGTLSCAHSVSTVASISAGTFMHELQHMISYSQHVIVHSGSTGGGVAG